MAHRHKMQHKNVGGAANAGGNPKVESEAKETSSKVKAIAKKDGGKVIGRASGGRLDKRARGGAVFKRGGKVSGHADHHPYSSAHLGK